MVTIEDLSTVHTLVAAIGSLFKHLQNIIDKYQLMINQEGSLVGHYSSLWTLTNHNYFH